MWKQKKQRETVELVFPLPKNWGKKVRVILLQESVSQLADSNLGNGGGRFPRFQAKIMREEVEEEQGGGLFLLLLFLLLLLLEEIRRCSFFSQSCERREGGKFRTRANAKPRGGGGDNFPLSPFSLTVSSLLPGKKNPNRKEAWGPATTLAEWDYVEAHAVPATYLLTCS